MSSVSPLQANLYCDSGSMLRSGQLSINALCTHALCTFVLSVITIVYNYYIHTITLLVSTLLA